MNVSSNAFLFVEKAQMILLPDNIRGEKIREKDEFISGREEEFWEEWDRKKNFITTHIKHFNLKFFKISVELKGKKKECKNADSGRKNERNP